MGNWQRISSRLTKIVVLSTTITTVAVSVPAVSASATPTSANVFNPLTASPTQLAMHGLPPKPSNPSSLKEWQIAMSKLRKRIYSYHSNPLQRNSGTSANWSGYVTTNGPFDGVVGMWNVPALYTSKSPNPSWSSHWVGVGGSGNNILIQTGTAANWNGSSATYDAWWEWVGPNNTGVSPQATGISVSPGQTMYGEVWTTNSGYTANFFIENESNGQYYSGWADLPAPPGNSAEWVVERTALYINGKWIYPHLADFRWVGFSDAAVEYGPNGPWHGYGSTGAVATTMYSSTGATMAYPSAGTNGAEFNVNWNQGIGDSDGTY